MNRSKQTPPPAVAVPPLSSDVDGADDWDQLFGQGAEPEEELLLLPEEASGEEAEAAPLAERYLGFRLGSEHYGVSIEQVSEVVRAGQVTPVPRVRSFLLGILSVRGAIVPVVDLRLRLSDGGGAKARGPRRQAATEGEQKQRRVLIAHQAGEAFGLLVDEVTHSFRLEAEQVEQPPQTLPRRLLEFVAGIGRVGDRVHILLDLDVVLRFDALVRADALQEAR